MHGLGEPGGTCLRTALCWAGGLFLYALFVLGLGKFIHFGSGDDADDDNDPWNHS